MTVATNRVEKNTGTRIAVFKDRKDELLAPAVASAGDAPELVDACINGGMQSFLEPYIGPTLVLEIKAAEISAETFFPIVKQLIESAEAFPPRLLIKSGWKPSGPVPLLTLEAVQYLHGLAIRLVGVDWPELDNSENVKYLLKDNDMVWLVNLDLSKVEAPAVYFLSAMPLRTQTEGETACRAILIPEGRF